MTGWKKEKTNHDAVAVDKAYDEGTVILGRGRLVRIRKSGMHG